MHPCEKTKKSLQLDFLEILLNNNIHVHALSFASENALQVLHYLILPALPDITGIMILFYSIMKQESLVFFVH